MSWLARQVCFKSAAEGLAGVSGEPGEPGMKIISAVWRQEREFRLGSDKKLSFI